MALTQTTGKSHARRIATWTGETTAGNASIQRYAPMVSLSTASVQVSGTIGGATIVLQGSNDGVTYATLKTPPEAIFPSRLRDTSSFPARRHLSSPASAAGPATASTSLSRIGLTDAFRHDGKAQA